MTSDLTEQQLQAFEKKLQNRFADLSRTISAESAKHTREQNSRRIDQISDTNDATLAELLVDIELALADQHIQDIRDFDSALTRIAEGSYGECCDCKAAIGVKRLKAFPTAKRCNHCQQIHDRRLTHDLQPA